MAKAGGASVNAHLHTPRRQSETADHDWAEIPGLSVRLMSGVLSEEGIDPVPTLRAIRIPLAVLKDPEHRIGWRQELAFQARFAELTSARLELWIETGRRYLYPMFDAFGLAMMAAPTLRHWCEVASTVDTSFSVGTYRVADIGSDRTGLQATMPAELDPSDALFRFTVYRDVASVTAVLDDLWQGRFPLQALEVPLDPVPEMLRRVVRCDVASSTDTIRWVWPSGLSDFRLPRANPMLYEVHRDRARRAEAWLRASPRLDDMVSGIVGRPGKSGMSLHEVAAELSLSPRTLQRKLDEYEVSFRELRDTARMRAACGLLRDTDNPVSEIADQLGYIEVASFSNAFRRWIGQSPTVYRRRSRSDGHARAEHPAASQS